MATQVATPGVNTATVRVAANNVALRAVTVLCWVRSDGSRGRALTSNLVPVDAIVERVLTT